MISIIIIMVGQDQCRYQLFLWQYSLGEYKQEKCCLDEGARVHDWGVRAGFGVRQ